MAKAELKTKATTKSVSDFMESIKDEEQREDSQKILKLMADLTGEKPVMWGDSMVGFGNLQLKYASGRELEWFKVGFSPRKQNLTLYVLGYDKSSYEPLLKKLGKHSTGVGCLYINRLSDVDMDVLKRIVQLSVSAG